MVIFFIFWNLACWISSCLCFVWGGLLGQAQFYGACVRRQEPAFIASAGLAGDMDYLYYNVFVSPCIYIILFACDDNYERWIISSSFLLPPLFFNFSNNRDVVGGGGGGRGRYTHSESSVASISNTPPLPLPSSSGISTYIIPPYRGGVTEDQLADNFERQASLWWQKPSFSFFIYSTLFYLYLYSPPRSFLTWPKVLSHE